MTQAAASSSVQKQKAGRILLTASGIGWFCFAVVDAINGRILSAVQWIILGVTMILIAASAGRRRFLVGAWIAVGVAVALLVVRLSSLP